MYTTHQEGKEGSLLSKEDSLGEISLSHDLNGNVISRENTLESVTQPSPEFLSQLNRIGELPKQYDDVAVQVRFFLNAVECGSLYTSFSV